MHISTQIPKPPPEIRMVFTRDEGWAVFAALSDWALRNPHAAHAKDWSDWAKKLDAELRR